MKASRAALLAALVVVIVAAPTLTYYYYVLPSLQPLKPGATAVYSYVIRIYGNATYVNSFEIKVKSATSSEVTFLYRFLEVRNQTQASPWNSSYVYVFDPAENYTYAFPPGSFGMFLVINRSITNSSGLTYVEYEGGAAVYVKYSVTVSGGYINVQLVFEPSLATYGVGTSTWHLKYLRGSGLLYYANGTAYGYVPVQFEYRLVNYSE